jgi:hypothetical protein
MSLLTLFQLNLNASLPDVLPENQYKVSARQRAFIIVKRQRAFAAAKRRRNYTAGSLE